MKTKETIMKVKNAVIGNEKTSIDEHHLVKDLNLDSLSLVDLIAEIEDELEINIYANHIFDIETVGDLREYIYRNTSASLSH